MPTYEYKHIDGFASPCQNEVIEVFHKMDHKALDTCPYCSYKIVKVVSQLNSIKSEKDTLSDKNLANKGFTKYKKAGNGLYEKVAGNNEAPATLDRSIMQANLNKANI